MLRGCMFGLVIGLLAMATTGAAEVPPSVFHDWLNQDAQGKQSECFTSSTPSAGEVAILEKALSEVPTERKTLRAELDKLKGEAVPGKDPRWKALYVHICEARRRARLTPLTSHCQRVVFAKYHIIPSSNVFYTEALSCAQNQCNFKPGSALCVLNLDGLYPTVETLLEDSGGVIRDPDISYDGKRILFAWKKSKKEDDYHLYEMDVATRKVRQLTSGLGFADIDGTYLPNGNIVFNSTRCVQSTDCNWPEVSNLHLCDKDGKYIRRIGFDQVHTTTPAVLEDGRVIYTRWDYHDRGQVYTQPLFQMNPDGTGQTEFYGNNSWFPTTIQFARGIPGTMKVIAILPGHHTRRAGKLAIIDPAKGRQEEHGVQLIAPVRETKPIRMDKYGQDGELFRQPYALNEDAFILSYAPKGWKDPKFGLYLMTADGRRELLVLDPDVPCNHPVPLRPRELPQGRPDMVDYRKTTGMFYVQDVYFGPGLKGIPRGAAKRLRVVALDFRVVGIGKNSNKGPAGHAMVITPISIDNGAWDVKRVLGETPIESDGSAFFEVPARAPIYFQVLDQDDCVIQTMRSWSTLQPGETFSCLGCHEEKGLSSSGGARTSIALKKGVRKLEPFYGPPRGFSFQKEIQPILDRHCIRCHKDRKRKTGGDPKTKVAFSLLSTGNVDKGAKRVWSDSYLALTNQGRQDKRVNWISPQSGPSMLPPYHAGSAQSDLVTMLRKGHNDVKLSKEALAKICCWIDLLVPYCGEYEEANAWSDADKEKHDRFRKKRRDAVAAEAERIREMLEAR